MKQKGYYDSGCTLTRSELLKASFFGAAFAAGSVVLGSPASDSLAYESQSDNGSAEFHFMLATDPHYLSPQLMGTKKYGDTISSGTMMIDWSEEIAQSLVRQVVLEHPDVFVMPGDLTYDGEPESHADFLPKLQEIADAGIPVLVIPGNHDVVEVDGVAGSLTAAEFGSSYAHFGLDTDQTIARDAFSMSYVWSLSAHGCELRFLMLDVNCVENPDTVPQSTLAWAEEQLEKAAQDRVRVIAVSHQLLLGNTNGYSGLWIANSDELLDLYERYGVLANLCGHIHGQRFSITDTGFVDATTAALSIYPLRIARIDVEIGEAVRIDYRTENLDVSGWAVEVGSDNPALLDFCSTGRTHHWTIQHDTMSEMLSGFGAETALAEEIACYFADISCAAQEGTADQMPSRQDLVDAFVELAGDSTANRFAPYLDPANYSGATTAFTVEHA